MQIIPWLEHHQERAARGVEYNALRNCHAIGLHSIMLHDEPGNRVRIFVANANHTLCRNRGDRYSVAIHPHHCDVRLIGLYGPAVNDVYALTPNPHGDFREMEYRSAITHGVAHFRRTGRRADAHAIAHQPLSTSPKLSAHQLHSIFLPASYIAAWLVVEGAEWREYESLCWTNDPDPVLSAEFYQKMNCEEVELLLGNVIQQLQRPIA
jgi:hypothetical protein